MLGRRQEGKSKRDKLVLAYLLETGKTVAYYRQDYVWILTPHENYTEIKIRKYR